MKMIKIALSLIAVMILFIPFNGCSGKKNDFEDKEGGRSEWTDPKAPKVIESKEIVSFNYEFRTSTFTFHGNDLGYDFCFLSLKKQESGAMCVVRGISYDREVFNHEFTLPLSVLDELQDVVEKTKLANSNGIRNITYGIPHYLGSSLRVEYVSGEKISAADNAGDVLGSDASLAVFEFFRNKARNEGYDFLHTDEEIYSFQERIEGEWVDMDNTISLMFEGNNVKIYEGEALVGDSDYYLEFDRLYNETESEPFGPFVRFEWRSGSIYGIKENGEEIEFFKPWEPDKE